MAIGGEWLGREWGATQIAGRSSAIGEAVAHCSFGHWQATAVVKVVMALGCETLLFQADDASYENDAALVADVQTYLLWRKSVRGSVPSCLQRAWLLFFDRYWPVVRRTVTKYRRRFALMMELDDLSQEIWREIVRALPRLAYNPNCGRASSWLAGLAKRKIRCLARDQSTATTRRFHSIDNMETPLFSPHLGPEDVFHVNEMSDQLDVALGAMREAVSHRTYEVFYRRYFHDERAGEVAASLEMTPEAVQKRFERAMQQWRKLTTNPAMQEIVYK